MLINSNSRADSASLRPAQDAPDTSISTSHCIAILPRICFVPPSQHIGQYITHALHPSSVIIRATAGSDNALM